MVSVEIKGHQFLKRQNHMTEEGVGKAARQRLLRAVDDEDKVGKLRELGVAPSGKGHDLMPVLLCVAHVVEDRLRLAALADGEHDRRLVIHRAAVRLLKEHPEIVQRAPLSCIASYLQMTPETLSRVRASL